MQRSRIAPTASVLREVDLHNTLESPCPDGNTWAPPPFPASSLVRGPAPTTCCLAGVALSFLGFGFSFLPCYRSVLGRYDCGVAGFMCSRSSNVL
jgi:hypothetical protein